MQATMQALSFPCSINCDMISMHHVAVCWSHNLHVAPCVFINQVSLPKVAKKGSVPFHHIYLCVLLYASLHDSVANKVELQDHMLRGCDAQWSCRSAPVAAMRRLYDEAYIRQQDLWVDATRLSLSLQQRKFTNTFTLNNRPTRLNMDNNRNNVQERA